MKEIDIKITGVGLCVEVAKSLKAFTECIEEMSDNELEQGGEISDHLLTCMFCEKFIPPTLTYYANKKENTG